MTQGQLEAHAHKHLQLAQFFIPGTCAARWRRNRRVSHRI